MEDFGADSGSADEKVNFLLRMLAGQRANVEVSTRCLVKLSLLCAASSTNQQAALCRGALESVTRVMRVHSEDSSVQSCGCSAIYNLSLGADAGADRFRPALIQVIAAIRNHASTSDAVGRNGQRALRRLVAESESMRALATQVGAEESWWAGEADMPAPATIKVTTYSAPTSDGAAMAPKLPAPAGDASSGEAHTPAMPPAVAPAVAPAGAPAVTSTAEAALGLGGSMGGGVGRGGSMALVLGGRLEELFAAIEEDDEDAVRRLLANGQLDVNGVLDEDSWVVDVLDANGISALATVDAGLGTQQDIGGIAGGAGSPAPPSMRSVRDRSSTSLRPLFLPSASSRRLNAKTAVSVTPLLVAVRQERSKLVALLLEKGADPNLTAPGLPPPLTLAALSPDTTNLVALLAAGAALEGLDVRGGTALMAASFAGHETTVEALCSRNASVSARAADGMHAVAVAALAGQASVLEILIRHGSPEVLDLPVSKRKTTPVMFAALHAVRSGDTRGVAHLVEAGADPDLQDASGLTAMDLASNQLRAARPSAPPPLVSAATPSSAASDERLAALTRALAGGLAPLGQGGRGRSGTGLGSTKIKLYRAASGTAD